MSVKIAPDARRQFINASGVPYSGAKLFYYAAGSTTKQNTYTTSVGNIANSNPIVLDSAGRTPYGVWFTAGLSYKEVLAPSTDTDPPGSPIYTEDNLSGVNDTSVTVSQWGASSLTPTYISTTSFSVPGDQTTELHVGRRLQFTVTAGTVYGRISVSAYTTLTTITVVMDSGQTLDSGLSSFNWSILTAENHSIPKLSGTLWDGIGVVNNDSTQTIAGNKTFSGTTSAVTAASTDNSTKVATTAHVLARLQNAPAFRADQSVSQSLTTATDTKITLGTEEFDTNNNFASSRFTPTVAGYYSVSYLVGVTATAITNGYSMLFKNGVEQDRGSQISTSATVTILASSGSCIVFMNGSTDYLELYANFTGTSLSATYSRLSGCLLRPS